MNSHKLLKFGLFLTYIVYGLLLWIDFNDEKSKMLTYFFQLIVLTMACFVMSCYTPPDAPLSEQNKRLIYILLPLILFLAVLKRYENGRGTTDILLIVYSVVAAVSEEMWFRKTFIDLALFSQKKYMDIVALVLGSLMWTFLHQQYTSWLIFLSIFCIGLFFGIGYMALRDVRWIIILHIGYNLIILCTF